MLPELALAVADAVVVEEVEEVEAEVPELEPGAPPDVEVEEPTEDVSEDAPPAAARSLPSLQDTANDAMIGSARTAAVDLIIGSVRVQSRGIHSIARQRGRYEERAARGDVSVTLDHQLWNSATKGRHGDGIARE